MGVEYFNKGNVAMNKPNQFVSILVLGSLLFFYNNCSSNHDPGSEATQIDFNSVNADCSLKAYFGRTYHEFLKTNCASCHTSSGIGKGAFADANLDIAYEAFGLVGYSQVSSIAINPGHNPPFTGPQNLEAINSLKLEWSRGEEERVICLGGEKAEEGVDATNWINSRSKAIPNEDGEIKLRWNLHEELLPSELYEVPELQQAVFEITVRRGEMLGQKFYEIYSPVLDLTGSSQDVTFRGLKIRINGEHNRAETTFTFLERSVRRGQGAGQLLSSGALIAMGDNLRAQDLIGLSFESISTDDLPPPLPGPKVNFRRSSETAASEGGVVSALVELDAPVRSSAVIVGIEIDPATTATARSSGRVIQVRDDSGNRRDVTVNNFDWDYSVDQLSIVFLPGETSKTINITLAEDDRYEPNDQIILRIGDVQGSEAGSQNRYTLTIPNTDPQPAVGEMTFSQLMRPGGVFYEYCLNCHNNGDRRGGLDLTDFARTIATGALVPGQTSSKLYVRMNSEQPNISPMPLTGLLPSYLRRDVEQWILNGAKNN